MEKRKIIFVNPAKLKEKTAFQYVSLGKIPPFNLAILASLIPKNWQSKIIDENIENLNPEECDILAIGAMTVHIKRAWEIAQIFRQKYPKIKILVGGIHASMNPEEIKKWADIILIGEAEDKIGEIFKDFEKNRLKKVYTASHYPDLSLIKVPPRFDLLKLEKYKLWPLQTTRGCPFGCDFCTVWQMFGKNPRHYSIDFLKKQIFLYKKRGWGFSPVLYFVVDDNIFADSVYAQKLFKILKKEKIKWFAQTSIPICFNKTALRLATESGCQILFIGFESISQANLKSVHKNYEIKYYKTAVNNCHRAGIAVYGAFILGMENDAQGIGKKTAKFALNINIDLAQASLLTPLPGTTLFNKLKNKIYSEENKRIAQGNWSHFDTSYPLWKHKNLSKKQLTQEFCNFYETFFNSRHLSYLIKTIPKRKIFQNMLLLAANFDFWQASKGIIKSKLVLFCFFFSNFHRHFFFFLDRLPNLRFNLGT